MATAAPRLPHGHPFLFVDRVVDDAFGRRTLLRVTAGTASDGVRPVPLPGALLLEAMAQSALALLSVEATDTAGSKAQSGQLVGIDEAVFDPALAHDPPSSGDTLEGRCQVRGRFGPMLKVGTTLERAGVEIARAELLLTTGS